MRIHHLALIFLVSYSCKSFCASQDHFLLQFKEGIAKDKILLLQNEKIIDTLILDRMETPPRLISIQKLPIKNQNDFWSLDYFLGCEGKNPMVCCSEVFLLQIINKKIQILTRQKYGCEASANQLPEEFKKYPSHYDWNLQKNPPQIILKNDQ